MALDDIRLPGERWKPVIGHPMYLVSDFGRVWSLKTNMLMKANIDDKGYETLRPDSKHRKLHHLVLEAFIGLRPAGHECGHLDGNPANNRLSNLQWITPKQNALHQEEHGTRVRSATHPLSKLTDADVLEIRRRRSAGEKWKQIAADYPVSVSTLIVAGLGRTFNHLDPSTLPTCNPNKAQPHKRNRLVVGSGMRG